MKIVFMVTKLKFQHELNLWMSINFWNGYKVPPKKLKEYCNFGKYN